MSSTDDRHVDMWFSSTRGARKGSHGHHCPLRCTVTNRRSTRPNDTESPDPRILRVFLDGQVSVWFCKVRPESPQMPPKTGTILCGSKEHRVKEPKNVQFNSRRLRASCMLGTVYLAHAVNMGECAVSWCAKARVRRIRLARRASTILDSTLNL